ncbi:MAG: NYN domain-containing protein [Anaerolineaceae bacterium]|jgi:predicted RNA-binding protein with PIN domain|nr:NYN domain-containing protein [Anaerolineaceae bacterium]
MKKLIIDGHNLVPKIPGLHLKDEDDEARLIEVLQEYCRLARCQAELFFDGSPEPRVSSRKNGLVHVHYIRLGYSADDAIIQYVRNLGSDKRNWTVVSSDHRIQNAALASGCKMMGSDAFSRLISTTLSSEVAVQQRREKPPSSGEIDEWLHLFDQNKNS